MRNTFVGCAIVVAAALAAALWNSSSSSVDAGLDAKADASQRRLALERAHGPATPGRIVEVDGTSIDLAGVMSRTRHAFRSGDGNALVGGDTTYGVRVSGSEISIHPEDRRGSAAVVGKPLTVHTAAVGRQGSERVPGEYVVRDDDGSLEASLAPAVTEHLNNTPAGLEQSWTFDEAPAGRGDLVVRLAINGEAFVGRTDSGIHFRDQATGLGMAMSHARWVDADGVALDLPIRYEDEEATISVPAAAIEHARYPATLDPTIGPEYDVDTPIVGPAYDDQSPVAIGHSGQTSYDFLVVWQDRRRTTDTDLTYDVFGAHVDRFGQVREPVGFLINDPSIVQASHSDGNQTDPQVEWLPHPGRYIVVWVTDAGTKHLAYRLLGYAATVPDPGTHDIDVSDKCYSAWEQTQPAIAAHGAGAVPDHVMIAWRENASGSGNGMLCEHDYTDDASDGSLNPFNGPLSVWDQTAHGDDAANPALASVDPYLPDRFITAFQQFEGATGTYQISYVWYHDGQLLPGNKITGQLSGHPAVNPSVASWGGSGPPWDGWLIAYEANDGTLLHPDYNVYAATIHDDGTMGLTGQHVNHTSGNQRMPSVAGFGQNDSQVFVAWTDSRSLAPSARGTRINLSSAGGLTIVDGVAGSGSGISMGGDAGNGVIAHSDDGSGYFAVWPDGINGSYGDVYGANVPFTAPANGTISHYLISKSANKETGPAVAQCGGKYLVAWTDTRNTGVSGKDIYGSLLNSDGTVAVQNIAISTASSDQQHPAIACLASPKQFFVVWEDMRNGSDLDIYGTGVDLNGAVLNSTSGVPIAATAGAAEAHPAIAGGLVGSGTPPTSGFAVAFELDGTYANATMINPDGTSAGGPYTLTPKGVSNGSYPDIDFDGANYVVVWQQTMTTPSTQLDITGARLSPAGAVNTPFPIESDIHDQRYPRIRFDAGSTSATVVYEDDRSLTTNGVDIYARRITSGGVQGNEYPIAITANDEYGPQIATRSGSLQEITYASIAQGDAFNFDVMGQSVSAGSANGVPAFAISNATTAREMTPSIACSALTCSVTYRWFSETDTTSGVDRVKARVLNY